MRNPRPMTTLEQLDARLHEQVLDVAHLRASLDIQMNRISHIPVEFHVLPRARTPRQSLRALPIRPTDNGTGHTGR
jgi:hypothetical protein